MNIRPNIFSCILEYDLQRPHFVDYMYNALMRWEDYVWNQIELLHFIVIN